MRDLPFRKNNFTVANSRHMLSVQQEGSASCLAFADQDRFAGAHTSMKGKLWNEEGILEDTITEAGLRFESIATNEELRKLQNQTSQGGVDSPS